MITKDVIGSVKIKDIKFADFAIIKDILKDKISLLMHRTIFVDPDHIHLCYYKGSVETGPYSLLINVEFDEDSDLDDVRVSFDSDGNVFAECRRVDGASKNYTHKVVFSDVEFPEDWRNFYFRIFNDDYSDVLYSNDETPKTVKDAESEPYA